MLIFSDIQMICYKLTESGIWSHEHINPLYLKVISTYIEDDQKTGFEDMQRKRWEII